ncbi:MAG: class II aldolase/adducin family protein [Candidatus Omnitrophota bacterium]
MEHVGFSFETHFVEQHLPQDPRIEVAIAWGKKLSEKGFCPSYGKGSHGNISFRLGEGMVITGTQTDTGSLTSQDFVEVVGCDWTEAKPKVFCKGARIPSTETLIHFGIYQKRPDVQAIIHAHDQEVLQRLGHTQLPITAIEEPSGSLALLHEIEKLLGHDYFIMRSHGVVALGKTLEEAGKRLLYVHKGLR